MRDGRDEKGAYDQINDNRVPASAHMCTIGGLIWFHRKGVA